MHPMVKIDLNRISIAGLVLLGLAVLLLVLDINAEMPLTVGRLLGSGAPLAEAHLWMAFSFLGLICYLTGRVTWIIGQFRKTLGTPPSRRRREDG